MSNQLNHLEDINQTNKGCKVMHSYPFIKDGPTIPHQTLKESTKQVPSGVFHIKPAWTPVKLDEKPPFSYATLIAHAILSSEYRKLTLYEIYQWISEQYPCYSMNDHRWQNSIRHNLSLQKAFSKLDRTTTSPSGKGCFWTILPGYEQPFIDNLVKRGVGNSRHYKVNNRMTAHKQLMETKSHKKSSHLFTIFRMNPTTPKKRKKVEKKQVRKIEYHDDSDCDSGIDLGEISFKKEMPLVEDTLLDDVVTSQHLSGVHFDNISTPSSIIDQNMFTSSLYWPNNIPQFNNYNNNSFELYSDLYLDTLLFNNNLFLPYPITQQENSSCHILYDD